MNLLELKEKIADHLATITIDDYYIEPDLSSTKALFKKLTGCQNDKDIEFYLINEIQNTDFNIFKENLENEIAMRTATLSSTNSSLQKIASQIVDLVKKIAKKQEAQKSIPEKQKQIEVTIANFDAEIYQIKDLAKDVYYAKRITELEKKKTLFQEMINGLPAEAKKITDDIAKLETRLSSLRAESEKEKSSIDEIETDIQKKQAELKELDNKKEGYFKKQAKALDFLLGILINKKKTNQTSYYDPRYNEWDRPPIKPITEHEVLNLTMAALANTATVPKDWRNLLHDIFSKPIPHFSGSLAEPDYERKNYLQRGSLQILSIDMAAFLSLNMASQNSHYILMQDNTIAIALTGGLLAKIIFRTKGKKIGNFQQAEIEFFAKGYRGLSRNQREDTSWRSKSEILYEQTGYANSYLRITVPLGYYILTDRYVIDISFEAAPMLLGAEAITRFAPNIAGAAKLDKEEELRREEERRREEEDWD